MNPRSNAGKVHMRLRKDGRKRLARLLIVQDISHRELADALGWRSHGMVGHLIAGRKSGVKVEHAVAIANYLGVDVADLFVTEGPTKSGLAGKPRRAA